MKTRLKLSLIIFSLLSLQVAAQEKKALGLNEAIDLGIQNSKQLKYSQAKIEEATAALKEAVEKRLPDAKAQASYLRFNHADFNVKSNPGSGTGVVGSPQLSQAVFGLVNLSLPIYTGGRIRYGIESSKFLEQAARLDAEDD